ncbi:MAG: gliding motility-associated C-terminal domain-containing protein [Saprospiraceae bacterium]
MVEAGHLQPDVDGNGVIDGLPAAFGLNGLYNPIASDPDDLNAVETYVRLDTDTDVVPDHDDLDSDNDGINDVAEAGYSSYDTNNDGRIDNGNGLPPVTGVDGLAPIIDPIITNQPIPLPPDKDADGIPDWHDLDSDNDLIHDVEEGGNPDPDDDAIIGIGVPTVNADGQATGLNLTPTSQPYDTDKDLIPDFHDLDSDNDGINDVREADGSDPDNDGLPGTGAITVNARGIPTSVNGNAVFTTSHPADTDTDLIRDYRDLDSDNDNINDVAETNKPDTDNNGRVGDGIPIINVHGQATAYVPTSAPTDTDNDGIPDFREKDSDDDGINDVTEANQPDSDFDGVIGVGFPSVDANGLSVTYLSTSKPTDTDANGTPDFQQLDSDADGIFDAEECPVNSPCIDGDGDLTADFQDPDRDNDGIFDGYECETGFPCPDTDNDGIPDVDDLDTDGDMISDTDECPLGDPCPDANANGIPEWREYFCNPNIVVPSVEGLSSSGTTFCAGSSVSFTAVNTIDVAGDSVFYNWVGPNGIEFSGYAGEFGPFPWTINNMTSQNAGVYTLYLFTEEGCVGNPQSITLAVTDFPQTPSLNVDEGELCEGQQLQLNSQIVQGNNIQYEWWFNDGNGPVSLGITDVPTFFIDDVEISNSGQYNVSVLSNGCASQLSNTELVTVDNQLSGVAPSLNVDEDLLCEGQTLELNCTAYNGANVQYHWLFNDGSGNVSLAITNEPTFFIDNVTSANSGNYTVMIVNGNCTSQFSNIQNVEVNNVLSTVTPSLSVDQDAVCDGQTIELNSSTYVGSNIQYLWWFDAGNGPNLIATTAIPTLFIPDASSANSGIYTVSVTMGLCETAPSNAQDIVVSDTYLGQTPQLSVLEDIPCEGTFIELNSTVLSGGNVNYNWYFNNGNGPVLIATTDLPTYFINNIDASNSGIYTVTASFGNCETQFSNAQDINVTTDLTGQTPMLSVVQSTLCEGEMLELNSTVANGSNVVYEWWFNDGTGAVSLGTTTVPTFFIDNVTASNAGVYEVTFSVGNCTSQFSNSQNVSVTGNLTNQTPSLAINESILCQGETLELNSSIVNGSNVTYEWFFNDGNGNVSLGTTDLPTFFISNVTTANSGIYTVQASVGNCTTQSSNAQDFTVTNALNMAPELSLLDDVICEGGILELNSTLVPGSNVVYHWWFNDGSGPIEIGSTNVPTLFIDNAGLTNAGVYSVSVSIGGCSSQLSNAQDVTIQPAPNLAVTNTTDEQNVACPGDLVELNVPVVAGATYQWFGPQGFSATSANPVIANTNSKNAGDYYVLVKTDGCDFTSAPTSVYVFDEVAPADDDFQILASDTLTTSDWVANDFFGNVGTWTINITEQPIHGTISLNANNELVYHPRDHFAGNDMFVYEICNDACPDQCEEAIVSLRVFLDNGEDDCFVPNIITPNDDGANDFFNIPCLEDEYPNNSLKIFNRWGDLVHQAQPYKNNWAGTYRNTPLPPGTYFYILQLDLNEDKNIQGYFTITR